MVFKIKINRELILYKDYNLLLLFKNLIKIYDKNIKFSNFYKFYNTN